jgi:hypothetical protein
VVKAPKQTVGYCIDAVGGKREDMLRARDGRNRNVRIDGTNMDNVIRGICLRYE